jgi:hypothetical protein
MRLQDNTMNIYTIFLKCGKSMMNFKLLLTCVFFVLGFFEIFAATYYPRSTGGNWSSTSSWSTAGCNGAAASSTPGSSDIVNFCNGQTATITLDGDYTVASLVLDNSGAGTLAMGNFNLSVTGTFSSTYGNTTSITQGTGFLIVSGNITNDIAVTLKNLRLGSSSVVKTANQGPLIITGTFDMNNQTSFTHNMLGYTSAPQNEITATSVTNAGSMSMAYSSTGQTFTMGGGSIPGGSFYNLAVTTSASTIACGVTVTVANTFTNNTTITGPGTAGQMAKIANSSNIAGTGTMGSASTFIALNGSKGTNTLGGTAGTNSFDSGTTPTGASKSASCGTGTLTLANPTTAVGTANSCPSSTNVPIHAFNIASTVANNILTNFSFTTTGSYAAADVSNFKIWYNSSNSLGSATLLSTLTNPGAAGVKTFSSAFSQTINNGSTGFFWITMDVASTVTNNNTITVSASASTDMTTAATKAGSASASGVQTLKANSLIALSSAVNTDAQTKCISNAITNITYAITGAGTGASISPATPAGISASFSGGTFTISGTPTSSGTYNYTVTASGSVCTNNTKTGTITVNPDATLTRTSAAATTSQTLCQNVAITNITYSVGGGGTGAGVTGLPSGVNGSFSGGTFTISGTPSVSGTFNYTVTTTGGGCAQASLGGTITVNPIATISLTSGTASPTLCINTALTNIVYTVGGGGTGASITSGALPAGVTGNFSGNTFTISGTPTASGTFNYTVGTSGTCTQTSASGTITVNPVHTISLTSGTASPSLCKNTALTNIVYTIGGGATSASITAGALPAGVNGSFSGSTFTISGTPTASGTFNYTVTTSGNACATANSGSQTITVNAIPTVTPGGADTKCQSATPAAYALAGASVGGGATQGAWAIVSGGGSLSSTVLTGSPATVNYTPAANFTGTATLSLTTETVAGCSATANRTVNVNPNSTISLTSAAGTDAQTVCKNSAITNITYTVGGGGTSASVTVGLPALGISNPAAGATITISGTPSSSGTINYTVTTSGGGCAQATATGSIISSNCLLTTSVASLTGFGTCSPSSSQSFTISGSNLVGSGNITVTGSANYEVSTNNSTFSNSVTYPYAAGVITGAPKSVFVRLKAGLAAGTYNGETITVSGSGPNATVTVSGTVSGVPATVSSSNFTSVNTNVANNYTITGATSYSWSRAAVTGITQGAVSNQTSNPITETLNNTTTSAIAVTYLITPFNASGCAGTVFTYVVSVNPINSVTCQAVPAAIPQPTCSSLTILNSGTTATTLVSGTSYGFCNSGSSIVSTGNIDGGVSNAPIYILSGQNVTISGNINTASNIYVFAGATLTLTGDFNTTGSNLYVYGTLNHAVGGTSKVQGSPSTIYIAPGGVYNGGSLQMNSSGTIINEGTMNLSKLEQFQGSAKMCVHNSGCVSSPIIQTVDVDPPNIVTFGGSVGYFYYSGTTCPTPNKPITSSTDMKICAKISVATAAASLGGNCDGKFGSAQVTYGCSPASNNCPGAIALPITLTFFKPTLTNEGVIVKWGTNSQWDSEYFIIEKSKNGIDWEYVNSLPSENGKYSYKEFSITDPNPNEGDSYYRLVEVDKDGKRTVYATDFIHNDKTFAGFNIYPNPSNGNFIVAISGDSPQYQMSVIDVLGKNLGVYTLSAGKNEINTALSAGIYLAKLKVGQDYYTQTIVVQ